MRRLAALLLASLIAATTPALAGPWQGASAEAPAVSGYDPVAYFSGAPAPGRADISAEWDGARFQFASAAHRKAFLADPARFAPQFGGHCAWAASEGRLARPDPTIWRIVDGKLYLNCSHQAEARWLADVPGNIARATTFWATQVTPAH